MPGRAKFEFEHTLITSLRLIRIFPAKKRAWGLNVEIFCTLFRRMIRTGGRLVGRPKEQPEPA